MYVLRVILNAALGNAVLERNRIVTLKVRLDRLVLQDHKDELGRKEI